MRQNNVDFQNRDLPTNILALLLAGEQRARQVREAGCDDYVPKPFSPRQRLALHCMSPLMAQSGH